MRRVEAREHGRRAGRCQCLRHIGRCRRVAPLRHFAPPHPFAADRQPDAEQHAEHNPHRRGQEAVIDRQFDEKPAAQRQRGATEPDQPVLDQEPLPVPLRGSGGRGGRDRFGRRGGDRPRFDRLLTNGLGRRCGRGFLDGWRCRFGVRWRGCETVDPLGEAQQPLVVHRQFVGQPGQLHPQCANIEKGLQRQDKTCHRGDRKHRKQIVPIHAASFGAARPQP